MTSARPDAVPAEVLDRFPALAGRPSRPLHGGLINDTFVVDGAEGKVVVQRLHPVFEGRLNEDLDAVTRHLARKGLVTPRLVRTGDGAAFVEHAGRPWRALTFVEGRTVHRVDSPDLARAAGRLVGRFHEALFDLEHAYVFSRGNVHDTRRHLAVLSDALEVHAGHRLHAEVRPLAESLLAAADGLPDLSHLPARHSHGDLKISNLLFDQGGRGLCLVDLDTLSLMIRPFELGDALRSWCNPGGEDEGEVRFDLGLFSAAVEGYAEAVGPTVTAEEQDALVDGVRTIALELAARFLADALHERYFGWDPARFASRGEHDLVRGRGQWTLYRSVTDRRDEARAAVERAFDRP